MLNDLTFTVSTDTDPIDAALSALRLRAQKNPKILKAFDERFPEIEDLFDVETVKSKGVGSWFDARAIVKPSERLKSFIEETK